MDDIDPITLEECIMKMQELLSSQERLLKTHRTSLAEILSSPEDYKPSEAQETAHEMALAEVSGEALATALSLVNRVSKPVSLVNQEACDITGSLDHPFNVLQDFLSHVGTRATFCASAYKVDTGYSGKHVESLVEFGSAGDLSSSLDKELGMLESGQELAFASCVSFGPTEDMFHIPMVDFLSNNLRRCVEQLSCVLGMDEARKFLFFSSGSSYHAYAPTLVSESDRVTMLGQLLLMKACVVDTKWVGHQLQRSYSALRWTNHTGKKKQLPQYVSTSEFFPTSNLE